MGGERGGGKEGGIARVFVGFLNAMCTNRIFVLVYVGTDEPRAVGPFGFES